MFKQTLYLLYFVLIQQVLVTIWNGRYVTESHASAPFGLLAITGKSLIVQSVSFPLVLFNELMF